MVQLEQRVPSVYKEFKDGNFVVRKSTHAFSAIAIDQAHEQMNAKIKGDGGVIGITENPTALIKLITAGPEIARITEEFEKSFERKPSASILHHDQGISTQAKFSQHVKTMVETIENAGNPFTEDSDDLITLDTKEVMSDKALVNLKTIEAKGESQYNKYVVNRLQSRTVPVSDIIPKNNMAVFQKHTLPKPSKTSHQIQSLKNSCELFGRLYISCRSRDSDMDEFFSHENQAIPPSLSDMGEMCHGAKSDLMNCLEKLLDETPVHATPEVDAKILDGSVIVNMLLPKSCSTFEDYKERVFIPYLLTSIGQATRLDILWDRYIENSLKSHARQQRGVGSQVIVKGSTPIPRNWHSFLRVDQNKTALYRYLSDSIAHLTVAGKELYSTQDTAVVSSHECDIGSDLTPCDHEEADSRIFLHVRHCVRNGHRRILIRSVDTDVVVLAIATFHILSLDELWIAFGVRNHYRMIPVHQLAQKLGEERSKALPFFHCFTGCDTASSFNSIGKKKAWDAWTAYPDITVTFIALSLADPSITEANMLHLERFVVLYDRSSETSEVNQARKLLFAKGRQLDRIPLTKAALGEHVKRATYQAGHADKQWIPFWTALPEAAKSCKELVKCHCKKACRPPCKCVTSSLPCTELCTCGGTCYRPV